MPHPPLPELKQILEDHQIEPAFSEEVMAEVAALEASPGLDDPALEDLTALPFVTIDYADSRDLDQALLIERARCGPAPCSACAPRGHTSAWTRRPWS